MAGMEQSATGAVPVNLFANKSRSCIARRGGTVPVSLLMDNTIVSSCDKLYKLVGRVPDNQFEVRSRLVNFAKSPSDAGRVPVRELKLISKSRRLLDKLPISVGKVPRNLF